MRACVSFVPNIKGKYNGYKIANAFKIRIRVSWKYSVIDKPLYQLVICWPTSHRI